MSIKAAAEVKHSAVDSAETVHPAQAAQVSQVLTDYIQYNMLENDERLPAITLPVS